MNIKYVFFTIFFAMLSAGPASSQETDDKAPAFLRFEGSNCASGNPAMLLMKGDKAMVLCDSAYLVNKVRYKLYEEARAYIMSKNPQDQQKLISGYEEALSSAKDSYQKIFDKYQQLSELSKSSLADARKSLQELDASLAEVKNSLVSAKKDLAEAQKLIRNERNKSLRGKLFWGAGGLGAGILTGILLAH